MKALGTLALAPDLQGDEKCWTLVAVDGDGTRVDWQNLDLTGVSKDTIHADGSADLL